MRFTPFINYYNTLGWIFLGHMNSIGKIVWFNILGRVSTSWTFGVETINQRLNSTIKEAASITQMPT